MSKTAAAKKSPAKAKPVAPPKSKNKVVAKPAVVKRAKVPVAAPGGKKVVLPPAKAVARPSRKPVEPSEPPIIKSNLPKKDLAIHRDNLLRLRDRIVDEIKFLANDSLNRSQKESSGDLSSHSFHMADQGTDNFDREFAANLLSSEQDVLYEIDEALRRIDLGTYGICEMSGVPIEKERLKFLPFARYSVAVQSEMERGKPRYRPFRRTSIQTAETQN
jgi:RNA polymerase-binding transcription factor DksA